jgi:DNA-binding IclR family transcriptional regulator
MQAETHAPSVSSAKAVERTMAILECLDSSRRGLNVSELSRRIRIPKSSAHVLLITLERLGYVRRAENGRDFRLSLKTYALGQRMVRALSLADVALPPMQALAMEARATVHLAILDHDQGVYIQKAQAPGLIQFDTYLGRRMDLHCTALGKVILAFSPPGQTAHIFAKRVFARYTPNTIVSPSALRREVARVRKAGYALDDEEEEIGVRCVAVPVLREPGIFLAALSLSGTLSQIPLRSVETQVARLRKCAATIAAGPVALPPLF